MAPSPGGAAGAAPPPPGAQMGAQAPAEITPQMTQMAQLVQRLMMQQKGSEYAKKMLRQLAMMLKGAMNSQFMQNPQAESDLADAFKKINSASDKLDRTNANTNAGPLQSMVADLMNTDGTQPPGQVKATPPTFPMSM